MRLTPIDIRRHQFSTRMRGYDREEVQRFLEAIVADFEDVVREKAQLRRESERLRRELGAYRGKEQTIQDTLLTTQGMIDELKRSAVKESELILAEAEVHAQNLLRKTEVERASLTSEITQMKHLRNRMETELRQTLQGYMSLIDAYQASRRPPSELRRDSGLEPPRPGTGHS